MRIILRVSIVIVMVFCFSVDSFSEGKKKKTIAVKNSAMVDGIENVLIYNFSFPGKNLQWSKIFVSKNKFGIDIPYGFADSANVVYSLRSFHNRHKWDTSSTTLDFNPEGEVVEGLFPTTLYGKTRYPAYLFYGDSVMNYSLLPDPRGEWINHRKLSVLLGTKNSVIGVVSNIPNSSHVLINSENERGENSIIKVGSDDNGYNWSLPSIAVKHNLVELRGWCIASKRQTENSGYIIMTDKNHFPYYSHTGDGGASWSYPKRISSALIGDNFKMSIDGGYVVVVFRCLTNSESNQSLADDNNDIMLWHGTLAEFVSNSRTGNLVKIIDNSPDYQLSDSYVEDIRFYRNKRYYVLIKNSDGESTSLQLHLIKRK